MFAELQQLAWVMVAQASSGAGGGEASGGSGGLFGGEGGGMTFLPLAMVAIIYFVLVLPARKERKQHQALLEALKRGDEVVTTSGLVGTIADITDREMTLEIAKNVKVRFLKTAIARRVEEPKAEEKSDAKAASKESKT